MQILVGSRREITLRQWDEQLEKARKKLADSEECQRRFGDKDSAEWVKEDRAKVEEIERNRAAAVAYMDAMGIK